MSTRIIAGIPLAGMKLSAATNKKVKAWEEAEKRYSTFVRENADCAAPGARDTRITEHRPAALIKAERELTKLDEKALADGKPLTNRDEFLKPVYERIDGYKRTEPLLRKAKESAEAAAVEAVSEELPSLARQALEQCTEEQKAYVEAKQKAEEAEARFTGSLSRFTQFVTGGVVQNPRYRGLNTRDDKHLQAWDVSENGRLTWMCAWSLGLVGPGKTNVETIDLDPFVEALPDDFSTDDIHRMTGIQ
ncbi:hypothetical protein [Streptomyces sp. NPDC056190]|uniref:hypothetical protein n=1 Tax=Streptomyces sp. NPDC056190 TaxID=3345741 RepID=UPI0035E2ED5B